MIRSRYRRIVFFFARLLLSLAYWELLLPRLGLRRWSVRTRPDRMHRAAAAYRILAVQMGGVLIKVGQFLSSRVDVLPREFTDELNDLQDEVPPANFAEIRRLAESELGAALEQAYTQFETTPLAAASLGQVHRATLATRAAPETASDHGSGRVSAANFPANGPYNVVVKVQRPGIEQLIDTDLAALRTVGAWLHRYRPIRRRADVPSLLAEFTRTLYEEIDYLAEGKNAETFSANFAEYPGVRVPRVVWSHTTRRVLTLENVLSIKITDYAAIEAAGISRSEVAGRLLDTYLKQIFEDGFFHADPHPGNLFVQPLPAPHSQDARLHQAVPQAAEENRWKGRPDGHEGGNGRWNPGEPAAEHSAQDLAAPWTLTFVDFGMVGRVPDNLRDGLREMVIGVGTRDALRVVGAYQRMDLLLPGADLGMIERAGARVFDHYWGLNMTELTSVSYQEMKDLADEFRELVYELPFQVPQNIIFLARCVGILSGMCTGLDPQFNLWEHLAPYARKLIAEEARRGPATWFSELEKLARSALTAPQKVDAILNRLERGDVSVRAPEVSQQVQRMEAAQRNTTRGIVFAALLIGGIQLHLSGENVYSIAMLIGAGFSLISLILGSRRR